MKFCATPYACQCIPRVLNLSCPLQCFAIAVSLWGFDNVVNELKIISLLMDCILDNNAKLWHFGTEFGLG